MSKAIVSAADMYLSSSISLELDCARGVSLALAEPSDLSIPTLHQLIAIMVQTNAMKLAVRSAKEVVHRGLNDVSTVV